MHVRRLQLTNYRNYPTLDLSLAPGSLLFLGDNAQGRSNLLEAAYVLAAGRSPRAGSDAELIARGVETGAQPFARLQASVERRDGAIELETIIAGPPSATEAPSASARAGKRFRVNGIPRRAADFVGQLRAVLFTADDLEIVSGSPGARRAFLDAALSQLDRGYHGALQRYGRIMQQRNASLRRIREAIATPDELTLWDESFSREGATLIAARQRAVRRLADLVSVAHRNLSGANEQLDLEYEPQLGDEWRAMLQPDADAEAVQPLFAAALAGQRRREIAAGLTLVGPHRDDVSVRLNGASAASFGSRAQIRTAALAIRLAEAALFVELTHDPPVLLLDDIVSELDERRRRSVLEGIAGFDQVWFSATSAEALPSDFVARSTVYTVSSGAVTPSPSL